MRFNLKAFLFTLLAPLTVPAYALFLAAANLLGGAFYVVIEATLSPILRRPISLTRTQLILLALPILVVAPIATAGHLLFWLVRLVRRLVRWLGTWQTGTRGSGGAYAAGALWLVVATWTIVTCLNAAVGAKWVERPVEGREAFVEAITRFRTLGELGPDWQARRGRLIAEVEQQREAVEPGWETLLSALKDEQIPFAAVVRRWPMVGQKLAGLPWFFESSVVSEDGEDHSAILFGGLLLAVMLLMRWPGMLGLFSSAEMRSAVFILRIAAAAGAVLYAIAWMPITSHAGFLFAGDRPTRAFWAASPAAWLGVDAAGWARPDWWCLNAGIWLAITGVAAFIWWLGWRISPFVGWPRYYVAFLASRLLQRKRIAFFSVGAVTLCVAMMIIVISVMGGFVDSIRDRAHGLLGDLVMDGGLQGFPYYQEFIDRIAKLRDERTGKAIVLQATPLIHSYGILQFPRNKKTKSVHIWGVRLNEYVRVNEFGKDLFYQNRFGGTTLGPQQQPAYGFDERGIASLPDEMDRHYREYLSRLPPVERATEEKKYARGPGDLFPGPGMFKGPTSRPAYEGRPYHGMIIGRQIIASRMPSGEFRRTEDYPRGEQCFLTVLPLTRTGDISPEPPPKPSFRYADDSRTGIHEIDSMNVYVDFERLQQLLSMGPEKRSEGEGMASGRCSQLQIKIDPALARTREALGAMKRQIWTEWRAFRDDKPADPTEYEMMRQVDVETWEEMQRSYISAIEKEKFLVLIMFGVISIVAVFLILCIFYMIVQEKTRDIGIIKSVGGSAGGVAAVFLAYGGAIGLVGCVLGSLLGTTFVEHINDVQDWLARLNPNWRVWSPETYSFDKIPDVWKWGEVIVISILAVLASIVGAAFPAIRAGRTWPVESLRYE